jgi:predicted nucleotidyltransferase
MQPDEGAPVVPAEIKEELCRDSDIEFVVVFGSRATGDFRPASDLDIAVKFADDLSSTARFRKRCHLSGHLQTSTAPRIDISDVDELPLEVAYSVVSGTFVCGNEDAFQEFKQSVQTEFEDRGDEIEKRQQEFIRRVAEDGLHG